MAQTFLFAASILLCLVLGQSLECKECLFDLYRSGCVTGIGTCTTEMGQSCLTITVTHHKQKVYRVYGCSTPNAYRCGILTEHFGQEIKVNCCKDGNMCNRKF